MLHLLDRDSIRLVTMHHSVSDTVILLVLLVIITIVMDILITVPILQAVGEVALVLDPRM
jgi:hypothetical protein